MQSAQLEAIKSVEAEMLAALARAEAKQEIGIKIAGIGSTVAERLERGTQQAQAMAATMPSITPTYAMDMRTYNVMLNAGNGVKAAFAQSDEELTETERHLLQLSSLIAGLPARERVRFDNAIEEAQKQIKWLREQSDDNQQSIETLLATLGSYQRVDADEFLGRAP